LFDRDIQVIAGDITCCDFTKGDNGGLIVFPGYGGIVGVDGELARAFSGNQNQLETVVDVIKTIFYGDSCHGLLALFLGCNDVENTDAVLPY
jgi:hypothetical protein